MNPVKNMSRDTCAHSFLIRLCSVDVQEWDHSWHLFRAMLSPPFWVLQQSDFIQDFISSLSFSMSRKKGGWKNLLAEMRWQKALIFIITSWWVRDSVIAETCLAAHPHTCFGTWGQASQHQGLAWGRRWVSQHIVTEPEPVQRCQDAKITDNQCHPVLGGFAPLQSAWLLGCGHKWAFWACRELWAARAQTKRDRVWLTYLCSAGMDRVNAGLPPSTVVDTHLVNSSSTL